MKRIDNKIYGVTGMVVPRKEGEYTPAFYARLAEKGLTESDFVGLMLWAKKRLFMWTRMEHPKPQIMRPSFANGEHFARLIEGRPRSQWKLLMLAYCYTQRIEEARELARACKSIVRMESALWMKARLEMTQGLDAFVQQQYREAYDRISADLATMQASR